MGRKAHNGYTGTLLGVRQNYQSFSVDENTAAIPNASYFVDTTSGAITVTLPAEPQIGDVVRIFDARSNFDTTALTVDRNGKLVMGAADNLTVNTEGAAFELVYHSSATGWRVFTI